MGKRKTASAWRVFLRALARTGNARAAAAEAGMDVGTAYDRRIKDAGFSAKWEAALAKAAEKAPLHRPGSSPGRSPSPGKPGEEFGVERAPRVRGSSGRRSGPELVLRRTRHGDKLVRAAEGRWCRRTEASFLAGLEATGCVRSAAAAAGISPNALYERRKYYPEFAARWREVEGRAAEQLPAMLRAAAVASLGEGAPASARRAGGKRRGLARLPKVNVDQAIRISRLKGAGGEDRARHGMRGGILRRKQAQSEEELTEALLKNLEVLRKRQLAQGWTETDEGHLIPPGWVRGPG